MIVHPWFRVEPWSLHETALNLDVLSQTESLFALSNGFIGVRGNLDEGEPHGIPGTYLNGVYELRPLPVAESQFGTPESSQTLIDVTNGKLIRLLVDDEPFDVALRPSARARSRARFSRRHADAHGGVVLAGAQHRARHLDALRLVHPSRHPRHRATRSSRSTGAPTSSCSRSWWPTRRSRTLAGDPRSAAATDVAARLRGARRRAAPRRCSSTARGAAGCASRRRWSTSSPARPRCAS